MLDGAGCWAASTLTEKDTLQKEKKQTSNSELTGLKFTFWYCSSPI